MSKSSFMMVKLDNGLTISPKHPIFDEVTRKWILPKDLGKPEPTQGVPWVFNFVTENLGYVTVNGTICATLG